MAERVGFEAGSEPPIKKLDARGINPDDRFGIKKQAAFPRMPVSIINP